MTRYSLPLLATLSLTACMEPQPAPDLPTRLQSEFSIEVVTDGLTHPWSVAPLGDAAYLITSRDGQLFRIDTGQQTEITSLPDDILVSGQGGLFDVILSTEDRIYISYAQGTADDNGTAVISAKIDGNTLTDIQPLFRATALNGKSTDAHFGGKLALHPNGGVMVNTGDGWTYREEAQSESSQLGKLIHIRADGSATVVSKGHRNPQGLAVDSATGQIWQHEHGPRGGDELNLIQSGGNYGWPVATQGRDYTGARISPHDSYDGMIDGVHIWTPSIAPSGLTIYRGDMFPDWQGDAIIGGLASRDIRHLDIENETVISETIILSDIDRRIRDIRTDTDGAILVLIEDDKDAPGTGQLLRVTPKR